MKSIIKKTLIVIITLFILLLILDYLDRSKRAQALSPEDAEPIPVNVVVTKQGDIHQWIIGEGTVLAINREFLHFSNDGRVVEIGKDAKNKAFRVGSRVSGPSSSNEKGDLLARIDDRTYVEALNELNAELETAISEIEVAEAELSRANSELSLSEVEYNRHQHLFNKGLIAKNIFEEIKKEKTIATADQKVTQARLNNVYSQISSVQARINQAKIDLDRTRIYAPFDGVIAYLNIRKGDYASTAELSVNKNENVLSSIPIVVIDPSSYEVELHLPTQDGFKVRVGQRAMIRLKDLGYAKSEKSHIQGYVHSLSPAINPNTRTVQVDLRFDENTELLADGAFALVKINVKSQKNAIILPLQSVMYRDNQPYVFVVDDFSGIAERRMVTLGIDENNNVEILEGLEVGEYVVTEGKEEVIDGEEVEILNVLENEV